MQKSRSLEKKDIELSVYSTVNIVDETSRSLCNRNRLRMHRIKIGLDVAVTIQLQNSKRSDLKCVTTSSQFYLEAA